MLDTLGYAALIAVFAYFFLPRMKDGVWQQCVAHDIHDYAKSVIARAMTPSAPKVEVNKQPAPEKNGVMETVL